MKKTYGKKMIIGVAIAFCCALAASAEAKVQGRCDDCHTMHNSQDGETFDGNSTTPGRALTIGDCVGCHSATDSSTRRGSSNTIPVVWSKAEPTTPLAGGNFYWLDANDKSAHNVKGIKAQDSNIQPPNTPPGYVNDAVFAPTGGGKVGGDSPNWGSNQLTCAGTYGCHGGHLFPDDFNDISGAHHGDDSVVDGSTVPKSYRFLLGITGIEDRDWEFTTTEAPDGDHNVYKGEKRTSDAVSSKQTISFLCGECHGNFHSGNWSGSTQARDGMDDSTWLAPWIRHPTDIDLSQASTGEYAAYTFNTLAPVAVQNLGVDVPGALTTGTDSIVTCISCHRAHGSANDDLLRWLYDDMQAHAGDTGDMGCFACHTTKDDA